MNEKCTHETTIVNAPENYSGFSVLRCTWGCGQDLIELDLGNHEVKTYTAADIIALRQRVAALEAAGRDAVRVMREEAECVRDNSGEGETLKVSLYTASFTLTDAADKLAAAVENKGSLT